MICLVTLFNSLKNEENVYNFEYVKLLPISFVDINNLLSNKVIINLYQTEVYVAL